jgi:hypothetical protein
MSNTEPDITLLKVKGEGSFTSDELRKGYVKSLASNCLEFGMSMF